MRTTIRTMNGNQNAVELCYDDVGTGDRVQRAFWCHDSNGSYIREDVYADMARDPQVCTRLGSSGYTLTRGASLVNTIRREYQAMRRAEKLEHIKAFGH